MKIHKIILHRLVMQLKNPFETSFGTFRDKDFFIVEAVDEQGRQGFGESVAFPSPWYTEETVETNRHVIEDFLIPLLLKEPLVQPDEVIDRFSAVRRNNMAKAAVEGAVWDLYAKQKGVSLAQAIGGTKHHIDVGVSVGIQPSVNALLSTIDRHLEEGYKRVKLKIKPGWDVDMLEQVRQRYPDISIMVDANSAYSLADIDVLKKLDKYGLDMMEQPLAQDDLMEHASLQKELTTPICLDESIQSFADAKAAVELGSCRIINIKIGRVGGITEAKRIHHYCAERNIPVWCGGMLEAGIGRAHNIALTALPQFQYPGDTSASNRYWKQDIIQPEVTMENGTIAVPDSPGIGYEINWPVLESYRIDKKVFTDRDL
ncbi:o-succinylbenzoate synthase [Sediminibacillus massiliensis]|uniref:o-succinylbenzoate synthase n=1 Tax=Sediminibacillus massiliensis TaxID=1926277 RepID=UPI0009885DD1|nr:o-succinylbenzoate synthase [Sediminibacillus massiliensis]